MIPTSVDGALATNEFYHLLWPLENLIMRVSGPCKAANSVLILPEKQLQAVRIRQ